MKKTVLTLSIVLLVLVVSSSVLSTKLNARYPIRKIYKKYIYGKIMHATYLYNRLKI